MRVKVTDANEHHTQSWELLAPSAGSDLRPAVEETADLAQLILDHVAHN